VIDLVLRLPAGIDRADLTTQLGALDWITIDDMGGSAE
jgi:hypothetical protein